MPTYRYRCDACLGEFEEWHSIHATETDHPHTHRNCGGAVARVLTPPATFGIGARGTVTREAAEIEARWNRDMPAYKRLVADGHQPQRIDGCGDLEQTAVGDFHIASGLPYSDEMVASRQEHVQKILAGDG